MPGVLAGKAQSRAPRPEGLAGKACSDSDPFAGLPASAVVKSPHDGPSRRSRRSPGRLTLAAPSRGGPIRCATVTARAALEWIRTNSGQGDSSTNVIRAWKRHAPHGRSWVPPGELLRSSGPPICLRDRRPGAERGMAAPRRARPPRRRGVSGATAPPHLSRCQFCASFEANERWPATVAGWRCTRLSLPSRLKRSPSQASTDRGPAPTNR
jgi:hypothetical protein